MNGSIMVTRKLTTLGVGAFIAHINITSTHAKPVLIV